MIMMTSIVSSSLATLLLLSAISKTLELFITDLPTQPSYSLESAFIILMNLAFALLIYVNPTRIASAATAVLFFIFLLISSYAWWNHDSCHCFGELVSSQYVAMLDLFGLFGAIGVAVRRSSGFISAKEQALGRLVGSLITMAMFLLMVSLTHSGTAHETDSAWESTNLIGRDLDDFVQFDTNMGVEVVGTTAQAIFYDMGCRTCMEHWQNANRGNGINPAFQDSIAIWRRSDDSWFASEFLVSPAKSLGVPSNVRFPLGTPQLRTPAVFELHNSRITDVFFY